MYIHIKSDYERIIAQEEINQMQVVHQFLLFQNNKLSLNTILKNWHV